MPKTPCTDIKKFSSFSHAAGLLYLDWNEKKGFLVIIECISNYGNHISIHVLINIEDICSKRHESSVLAELSCKTNECYNRKLCLSFPEYPAVAGLAITGYGFLLCKSHYLSSLLHVRWYRLVTVLDRLPQGSWTLTK